MTTAICTTTVGITITTWTLSMEVKSIPIRDHQEGKKIASQLQTLHRWKSKSSSFWHIICCHSWSIYNRKFEEKLAKDFPLRADGQKTTLELVSLLRSVYVTNTFWFRSQNWGSLLSLSSPRDRLQGLGHQGDPILISCFIHNDIWFFLFQASTWSSHTSPASQRWKLDGAKHRWETFPFLCRIHRILYLFTLIYHPTVVANILRLSWTNPKDIPSSKALPFCQIKCLGNLLHRIVISLAESLASSLESRVCYDMWRLIDHFWSIASTSLSLPHCWQPWPWCAWLSHPSRL